MQRLGGDEVAMGHTVYSTNTSSLSRVRGTNLKRLRLDDAR